MGPLLLLSLFPLSCSDEGKPDPCKYEGITVTDTRGNVISNDPDDWVCPADTVQGRITRLYPAEPNPFNPRATVKFTLARDSSNVRVVLYAPGCVPVKSLVDTVLSAGPYALTLDQYNDQGDRLPAGIYRLVMTVGNWECHGDVEVMR